MITGFDNYVYLNEDTHQYFDRDGREYESVSSFKKRFKEPFDSKNAAQFSAGKGEYINMTPSEVEIYWKQYGQERADVGTRIHNAVERYLKTLSILPEDEDLTPTILSIAKEYSTYYRILPEQIVYNTEFMIAGTIDLPLITTSHKHSVTDIDDLKTYLDGIRQKSYNKRGEPTNKYMLGPLSHLQDSKYNELCVQLSLYAWMVEEKTGRKIGQLRGRHINPNNPLQHYPVPCGYLKGEVIEMLKHKKSQSF